MSNRRVKIAAGAIATVVIVIVAAIGIGRFSLERRISREVDELFAARADDTQRTTVTEADLAGLPEPVQRWLRNAQVVGTAYPRTVRLKMEGEFRLGEDQGWIPFEAEEYYTTDPPGFVWAVQMQMAPLLTITGRDRYVEGTGDIDMRVLSLIPVAQKSGGSLNQGALLRYLNETMWFPAAAVSPYITWEAIDANSAEATMTYGGITAAATFIFDEEGRLTNMTAERYNDAKDQVLPWSTLITAYAEFHGLQLPAGGQAIWHYATGEFPYIRLRVTEIEYNNPAQY